MAEENPISHRVQWLLEERVIYIKSQGNMSEEELITIDNQVVAMLDTSQAEQVHVVVNVTELEDAPSLPALVRQKFLQHPRFGWYITVGANALLRFLGATTGRLTNINFQFARSLGEAKSHLQRIDETLPDLTSAFNALKDDSA
ncbi:MAG: hypothetical protein AAFV98_08345 [Chloroflexota bacterium]